MRTLVTAIVVLVTLVGARAQAQPDPGLVPCPGATPAAARMCSGLDAAERGQWAEAEAALESALVLVDPIVEAHRAAIDLALAEARTHLGSLDVRCGAGAIISVDGLDRGLDPLERPLRLPIGAHVVRCAAADHEPAEHTVTLEAGALSSITLAPTPIDRRPVLERVGSPGEAQRIVGIAALSLGGVSLAIGLGALIAGLDADGAAREPYFDVARGTLITSGALVIAGLVLVLTAE